MVVLRDWTVPSARYITGTVCLDVPSPAATSVTNGPPAPPGPRPVAVRPPTTPPAPIRLFAFERGGLVHAACSGRVRVSAMWDMMRQPQAPRLVCLMILLEPLVLALVTASVRATRIAGHQVSMVVARRVVSG